MIRPAGGNTLYASSEAMQMHVLFRQMPTQKQNSHGKRTNMNSWAYGEAPDLMTTPIRLRPLPAMHLPLRSDAVLSHTVMIVQPRTTAVPPHPQLPWWALQVPGLHPILPLLLAKVHRCCISLSCPTVSLNTLSDSSSPFSACQHLHLHHQVRS